MGICNFNLYRCFRQFPVFLDKKIEGWLPTPSPENMGRREFIISRCFQTMSSIFPKRWNGTKFFECCRQFPDYLKRGTPVLEFKVASHIVLPTCTWEVSIFKGGVDWPCQIWSSDCPGEVIISEREGKLSWSNQISNHPNLKCKLSMRSFHFEVGWWGGGANYVWSRTNILIPTVN